MPRRRRPQEIHDEVYDADDFRDGGNVVAGAAGAQTFPGRSVTLTVGFAPGGGTDTRPDHRGAPGKTLKDLLDFWNRELVKALNDPKVKVELAKRGLDSAPDTREELAQYMERESQKWGKVVREAKITAE